MNIEKLKNIQTEAGTIRLNRDFSFYCLTAFVLDTTIRIKTNTTIPNLNNAFMLGLDSLFIIGTTLNCIISQNDLIKLQNQSKRLILKK